MQVKDTYPYSVVSTDTAASTSSISCIESLEQPVPRFKLDDFDILKHLSSGGSSKVFLVRHRETDAALALKVISKKDNPQARCANVQAEQKIQAMLSMSNEGLYVPLVASWHDRLNFYIATEYCAGGDMALELMRCRRFEANRARFYMAELVVAIERLHAREIIHRDVKPANILFDKNGHLLLGDFGLSKWFEEDNCAKVDFFGTDSGCYLPDRSDDCLFMTTQNCGTPLFMSPEQHTGKEYSFPVDVWAMGVTLYRMITGRMPFGNDAQEKQRIKEGVIHDQLVFQNQDAVDKVTKDLLKRLLAKKPEERPTIQEIKQHAYFNGVEWDTVVRRGYEAPWAPFNRSLPKHARSVVPIREGEPYRRNEDTFPDFTWRTTVPQQNAEGKKKKGIFNSLSMFRSHISGQLDRRPPLPSMFGELGLEFKSNAGTPGKKKSLLRLKGYFR